MLYLLQPTADIAQQSLHVRDNDFQLGCNSFNFGPIIEQAFKIGSQPVDLGCWRKEIDILPTLIVERGLTDQQQSRVDDAGNDRPPRIDGVFVDDNLEG